MSSDRAEPTASSLQPESAQPANAPLPGATPEHAPSSVAFVDPSPAVAASGPEIVTAAAAPPSDGPIPAAPAASASVQQRSPVPSAGPAQRATTGSPRSDGGEANGCTAAQLRRFVKSRAYVPLHELRRRFDLPGSEDDVSPVAVDGRALFVGLPQREAGLLGELLTAGDVGYELLLDPSSPLIVGLFPMRPVPRG